MNGHTEAAHQEDDTHRPNYTLIKQAEWSLIFGMED